MVRTRNQLENLSKNEHIDKVLRFENLKNNINPKFSELNDCFNEFEVKYEMVTRTSRFQVVTMRFYPSLLLN